MQLATGLSKLELLVALSILAGIAVFMALQFTTPKMAVSIDEAYSEIRSIQQTLSESTSETKPDVSTTNLFELELTIRENGSADRFTVSYGVPTSRICSELHSRLMNDTGVNSNSQKNYVDGVQSALCIEGNSNEDILQIEYSPLTH